MNLRRMLRDLDGAGRSLIEGDGPRLDDQADGYELTVSARDFSHATRKVVDEKLTFSAALVRAGEVEEARRILAEVEHDVRNEEAALLEKVNEVSAKRAVTRSHMTRLRLVRLLATAMVGAGLLGVSAMGMALAGMFEDPKKGLQHRKDRRDVRLADARDPRSGKRVVIGGVAMKLNKEDLKTFRRLTSGSVDAGMLKRFLVADLDLPPDVADHTIARVLSLTEPVVSKVEQIITATTPTTAPVKTLVQAPKKKTQKAKDEAATEVEPTTEESSEEEPEAEETPEPEAKKQDSEDGERKNEDGQETSVPGVDGL